MSVACGESKTFRYVLSDEQDIKDLEGGDRITTRRGSDEPITVMEVSAVVLKALAAEFGDRVPDADTARHGLAHAAFTLREMHLREVASSPASRRTMLSASATNSTRKSPG